MLGRGREDRFAQRDGFDFNLAFIGSEFTYEPVEQFDNGFMNALYDYGYELGKNGYPWQQVPPGWESAILATQATSPPQPEGETTISAD